MTAILASIRQALSSRNLMVITLTQGLFMFTASLWWPYWSLYIQSLGASVTLVGLIFMAEMLFQLVFQLPGGFTGVMGARFLGGVSEGFGGAVTGIEGGSAWLALVADITPSGQRGMVMGLIGTIAGLLSLPGSSLGGAIYDNVSPQAPFYLAAASGLAAFIVFTLFVKEPKTKAD
jgi:MFS family permease